MFTTPYFDLLESHLPDPPNIILFVLMAFYAGWAWIVLQIPILKRLATAGWSDNAKSGSLLKGLEGFRGLLAFWVVWTHLISIWMLLNTGVFRAEEGQIRMASIGSLAVGFFFPITGFLFWSKALRSAELEYRKLYIDRLFRIVPLFLFVATLAGLLIIIDDPNSLRRGLSSLTGFASLFTLGGTDTSLSLWSHLDIGMAWSLRYEMLFYALLPLVFVARSLVGAKVFHVVFPILINYTTDGHFLYYIWGGCFVAEIVAVLPRLPPLVRTPLLTSVNAAALPLTAWLAIRGEFWYSYWQLVPILVIILALGTGSTFHSILKWGVFQVLGRVSYSTYLVHGVVVHCVLILTRRLVEFPRLETFQFAVYALLIMPLIIVVSILTYSCVEVPFMKRSRELTRSLGTRGP